MGDEIFNGTYSLIIVIIIINIFFPILLAIKSWEWRIELDI